MAPDVSSDVVRDLGLLALGSRLRRLSDRLMTDATAIYRAEDTPFEPSWFPLFRLLAAAGPTTVGDAARALGVTHVRVSQSSRAMIARRIATSTKDTRDERRTVLSLTAAGHDLVSTLQPIWNSLHHALRDVVATTGVDLLAVLDGIEHALEARALPDRTAEYRRAQLGEAVSIVDYEPRWARDFEALNVEWLERWFSVEPVDREMFARPEASIIAPGGAIFFAQLDERIVGTCALVKTTADTYELTKMAVASALRGRQIGRRLAEHAIEVAEMRGARRVCLVTNSGLTPAVALYRSLGFRVTRVGPHPKYQRGDLTMELMLAEAPGDGPDR